MELEILADTKMLLGISDESEDKLLLFLINDTAAAVTAYCRIAVVPNQLYGLIAQIAAELYRARGETRAVKALTEGDRRVEFDDLPRFENYISRLEPFVNRMGKVPSELTSETKSEVEA